MTFKFIFLFSSKRCQKYPCFSQWGDRQPDSQLDSWWGWCWLLHSVSVQAESEGGVSDYLQTRLGAHIPQAGGWGTVPDCDRLRQRLPKEPDRCSWADRWVPTWRRAKLFSTVGQQMDLLSYSQVKNIQIQSHNSIWFQEPFSYFLFAFFFIIEIFRTHER